jgi:hypothetical protein
MFKYLSNFLFYIFCHSVLAQSDSDVRFKNNFHFAIGYEHTRLIDEGFSQSKLLFRGTNPVLNIGYKRINENFLANLNFKASPGSLITKQGGLTTEFYNVYTAIEYLKNLKLNSETKTKDNIFVGLQLSSTNYALISENVFDNYDLFSLHGLYLKMNYELNLKPSQRIIFSYALPTAIYANHVLWNSGASIYDYDNTKNLLALVSSHGEMTYLKVLNNIPIEMQYQKRFRKKFDYIFKYNFSYTNYKIEAANRYYTNGLMVTLKFNF